MRRGPPFRHKAPRGLLHTCPCYVHCFMWRARWIFAQLLRSALAHGLLACRGGSDSNAILVTAAAGEDLRRESEAEDFYGAGGSALPATRPRISSGHKASDTRLKLLIGVWATLHHCNKPEKDKQLNNTVLARHLYNSGTCPLTVR